MEVLIWAILIVVFVVVEIVTVQLVSVWLAAGALITLGAVYFFDIPFIVQLAIFVASSGLLLLFTFPFLRKRLECEHIATNAELDIGKNAVVIEDIDNDNGTGRVSLSGVDWRASSASGINISKGDIVTVTEIKGTRLIVKLKD